MKLTINQLLQKDINFLRKVILSSNRKHSTIYNGKKDRIMIGTNFYNL